MFRFGGFKASLNFSGRSTTNYAENIPTISSTKGAYRVKKDEFYGNGALKNSTPRLILPSMVKLPPSSQNDVVRPSKSVDDVRQPEIPRPPPSEVVRPTKSTGDLTQAVEVTAPTKVTSTSKLAKTKVVETESNTQAINSNNDLDQTANVKPKLRTGADVSLDPRGGPSKHRDSADLRKVNSKDAKKREKEQKMIEKKRLAEEKKNEKLAAQERAKQEKLRKEQEKREAKLSKQKAKTEKLAPGSPNDVARPSKSVDDVRQPEIPSPEQKKNEKLAAQERAKQEKLRKEQEKREAKLSKQKAKTEKLAPGSPNDVARPSKSVDDVRQPEIPSPEQKKNDKLAAQERAKQEKLRKEQEKREAKLAKQKAKNEKKDKGKKAPVPTPRVNPLAQGAGVRPSQAPAPTPAPPQYAESSISRTSGPPAYVDIPTPKEQTPQRVQSENVASGNTSFAKNVDSWDLIAEHRQQITRPGIAGGSKPRQKVMDLQYHTGKLADDRQTEA